MIIDEDEYLAHFGKLGMKWGKITGKIIRDRETYNKKLKASVRNAANPMDKALMKERLSPLGSRLSKSLIQVGSKEFIAGLWGKKFDTSPKGIARTVGAIGIKTIGDTVYKDLLAKNVSKRYTATGGRKVNLKKGAMTPEAKIMVGVNAARVAVIAVNMLGRSRIVSRTPYESHQDIGERIMDRAGTIDSHFVN